MRGRRISRTRTIVELAAECRAGPAREDTGGFLLENTNDLGAGVARMQQSARRTTCWHISRRTPTSTENSERSTEGEAAKMTVRARPGYVALPSQTGK